MAVLVFSSKSPLEYPNCISDIRNGKDISEPSENRIRYVEDNKPEY